MNPIHSFYDATELAGLGLAKFGADVFISRKASLYFPEKIELGSHVRIDDFCILSGGGGIRIGNYVHIAPLCGLYAGSGIEIADFATLSSRVALYSETDDFSGESMTNPTIPMACKPGYQRGKISIGRHCIIGTGVTILPNVTIGEGTALGAHAFVRQNCPPWSIYAGIPARWVKPRSQALLKFEPLVSSPTRFPPHRP
jgi:galactoside O-acetyltransferase